MQLEGKTAFVTGSTSGIGLGIATALAKQGCAVALNARKATKETDDLAAKLSRETNAKVIYVAADMSAAGEIHAAVAECEKQFGKLDIVVNNAGTSRAGPFEAMSDELLQEDLELKLFAAVRFCRLAIPQMKERKWGRIINVLNIGAKAPRAASAPTSVSRAAGMALT